MTCPYPDGCSTTVITQPDVSTPTQAHTEGTLPFTGASILLAVVVGIAAIGAGLGIGKANRAHAARRQP